jgi:hypothetical protein
MASQHKSQGEGPGDQATNSAFSTQLLDETIAFWQPRVGRELSREDARQILENLTGFFRTLARWEAEEQAPVAEPTEKAA